MNKKTIVAILATAATLAQPMAPVCAMETSATNVMNENFSERENVVVKTFIPYINGVKIEDFSKVDKSKLKIRAVYYALPSYNLKNLITKFDDNTILMNFPKTARGIMIEQDKIDYKLKSIDYNYSESKDYPVFGEIDLNDGKYLESRSNLIAANFEVKYDLIIDISKVDKAPTKATLIKPYKIQHNGETSSEVSAQIDGNKIVFKDVEYYPNCEIKFDVPNLKFENSAITPKENNTDVFKYNPNLNDLKGNTLEIVATSEEKKIDKLNIKDDVLRKSIYEQNNSGESSILNHFPAGVDRDEAIKNNDLYPSQIEYIKNLKITDDVKDITGLELLTGLTYLNFDGTNNIKDYSVVNKLSNLEYVEFHKIPMEQLDLSGITKLKSVKTYDSISDWKKTDEKNSYRELGLGLKEIKFSENNEITWLGLAKNNLKKLDLSKASKVEMLDLSDQLEKIEEVNVKALKNLKELHLDRHNLKDIDLSENKNLSCLSLNNTDTERGRIESLDLSNNHKLTQIHLKDNKLKELKLSNLENEVSGINLHGNNLQFIDLSMISVSKDAYVDIAGNTTELQGSYKNGVVTVDLKQIDGLDTSRVMVDNTDKVSYDREKAIVTIKTDGQDSVELVYRYDTKIQDKYSPHRGFPLVVKASINFDKRTDNIKPKHTKVEDKTSKDTKVETKRAESTSIDTSCSENLSVVVSSLKPSAISSSREDKSAKFVSKANTSTVESKFNDLKGHWAEDKVNYLVSKGYFKGINENNFSPDNPIKGTEFITVLGRIASVKDENSNEYYNTHLAWANQNNILKGLEDFEIKDDLNREEMALILDNFVKFKSMNLKPNSYIEFKDEDKISDWAKEAVKNLSSKGILKGMETGEFSPKTNFTRAQAAQVLYTLDHLK